MMFREDRCFCNTLPAGDICGKSHGRHCLTHVGVSFDPTIRNWLPAKRGWEEKRCENGYFSICLYKSAVKGSPKLDWWIFLKSSPLMILTNRIDKKEKKRKTQIDREPVVSSKAARPDHSQNGRVIVMPHCFHHSLSSFLSPILRSLVVPDQFHLFIYLIRTRRLLLSLSSRRTFFTIESNPLCNINEWIIRWCWFHRISHRAVNRTSLSKTPHKKSPLGCVVVSLTQFVDAVASSFQISYIGFTHSPSSGKQNVERCASKELQTSRTRQRRTT